MTSSKPPCLILQGDCLRLMDHIKDASIDLVLSDLPYGTTRAKWDQSIDLDALWNQYRRILKPTGAVVLTASQPFTSKLVVSNLDWFRCEWIWSKNIATGFLDANRKPLKAHESVLVFSPRRTRYFPQDVVRRRRRRCKPGTELYNKFGNDYVSTGENFPRSIVSFKTSRTTGHSTEKPVALMEYLINTYSVPGETILDNCMGSGTTGVAALNTSRHFIGIEKDPEWFDIANQRLSSCLK